MYVLIPIFATLTLIGAAFGAVVGAEITGAMVGGIVAGGICLVMALADDPLERAQREAAERAVRRAQEESEDYERRVRLAVRATFRSREYR